MAGAAEKALGAKLRTASPGDAARLNEIYSYYVKDTAVSFEYDVPTVDEFERRIKTTLASYPFIVLEIDGKVVGYAYAGVFKARAAYDRSCEVSVYVDRGQRRRGYGRLLYETLENELITRGFLNMYACIAYPSEEDEYLTKDSALFHERLGFTLAGVFHKCGCKFGRWYDMIWMEKLIGAHENAE